MLSTQKAVLHCVLDQWQTGEEREKERVNERMNE